MPLLDFFPLFTASSATHFLVSSILISTIYILVHTSVIRKIPSNAPPTAHGNYPILGSLGFFTKRYDFFKHAANRNPHGHFSFHAGPHTVIGLTGESGRRVFFENKDLDLAQGYAALFNQAPSVKHPTSPEEVNMDHFKRRLTYLLRPTILRQKLPILLNDVRSCMSAMSKDPSALIDPFETLYDLVFKLTIRQIAADDIAEDPSLSAKFLRYYEMIERSATASSIIFPHLPLPGLMTRLWAGMKLWGLTKGLVDKRVKGGVKKEDALQFMIDKGDGVADIIEFVVGGLVAGVINSGINVSITQIYLALNPHYLSLVREEVAKVASKYSPSPTATLHERLAAIPVDTWELEFPIVTACFNESIRLTLRGTMFRRNIGGKDIALGNREVIPPSALVAYQVGDIHFDERFYPDPWRWDPSRHLRQEESEEGGEIKYIGWGAGMHPCAGMRFAKLEQNIITAFFVSTFNFDLQDTHGNPITDGPKLNLNRSSAHKPNKKYLLKLTPRETQT